MTKLCLDEVMSVYQYVNGDHNDIKYKLLTCILKNNWLRKQLFEHKTDTVIDIITDLKCGAIINLTEYQPIELCKAAIDADYSNLQYVYKQTKAVCLHALKISHVALKHIRKQTDILCMFALSKNVLAMKHVKKQSPSVCYISITKSPLSIRHIKNPTNAMCEFAIMHDTKALKYINQTKHRCMLALNIDPKAIMFIKKPTKEMYQVAFKNPLWLQRSYIRNNAEKFYIQIFKYNGLLLQYISKRTWYWTRNPEMYYRICLAAAKQNIKAMDYINNDAIKTRVEYELNRIKKDNK